MTLQNSRLFRHFSGSDEMREVFSDTARAAHFLRIEVALAKVEADFGIIPASAHEEIARRAAGLRVNWERLRRESAAGPHSVLALVHQLAEACGSSAEYLHWGSAARDVSDTAFVLQVREALNLVERDALRLRMVLQNLAEAYQSAVMMSRFGGLIALPTTFGFSCSVWVSEIDRHLERLQRLRVGLVAGRFRASVGTLNALGPRASEVRAGLMRELALETLPRLGLVLRDHICDVVFAMAALSSALARIASTVLVMARSEVQELGEAAPVEGMRSGASAAGCELVIAHARMAADNVAVAMASIAQPLDRDRHHHLEYELVPQTFLLVHEAVGRMGAVLAALQVNPARMRQNIEVTRGLVMAESVMLRLAEKTGRRSAHRLMSRLCEEALRHGRSLRDMLLDCREVTLLLSPQEIDAALDPANCLGPDVARSGAAPVAP